MNFIIKLPNSKDPINEKTYGSIFVMIDKLTKYIHVILFIKNYTVVQLKKIFLDKLIRYHELLKNIINDRNKFFTFNYEKTFIAKLKTKFKLSTVYHSKTND